MRVWAAASDAFVAQLTSLTLTRGAPRCTVAPYTDVRVVNRDVGFKRTTLDSETQAEITTNEFLYGRIGDQVAQIESLDGRCFGYVAAAALTD